MSQRTPWLVSLAVLQGLGALPLLAVPVAFVFALISSPWFVALTIAYPVVCIALFVLSWVIVLRADRPLLALFVSAPPAIATVAGVGLYFAVMVLSIGRLRSTPIAQMKAVGDLRTLIQAEAQFKEASRGSYGTPECLASPEKCIPGYSGPPFLAANLSAPERAGYRFQFHPGSSSASPHRFESYAYTAIPLFGKNEPRYCADDSGRVCVSTGSGEPQIVGGRCDPCQAFGGFVVGR